MTQPQRIRHRFDQRVPMRDGVELSVDLYMPEDALQTEGKFPAILQRTPYDNTMRLWVDIANYFAARGYVMVMQDVRGRCDSDGEWEPFVNEAEDGHDTVEWIARQPWSNGKVGMMGGSYGGLVQWMAARERPPHLTTLVSTAAAGRIMEEVPWGFGKIEPVWGMWWLNMVGGRTVQPSDILDQRAIVRTRPSMDVDKTLGRDDTAWRTWLAHPNYDAYWERMSMKDRFSEVDLPVLHITGWFDGDQWGQMYYWHRMMQESPAATRQYLLSGPWDHAGTRTPKPELGGLKFGPHAVLDMNAVHLRWFDYWLKGEGDAPTDFADGKRSRVFVMGTNVWRDDPTWPPPDSTPTPLYFRSGGRANSLGGDGRLTWQAPTAEATSGAARQAGGGVAGDAPDEYTYDPENPTPSQQDPESNSDGSENFDDRWRLRRDDVLVYTSDALDAPVETTGHPFVIVHAATDVPDTDFTAMLEDVFPDGRSMTLASGILRSSYGEGFPVTARGMGVPEPGAPDAASEAAAAGGSAASSAGGAVASIWPRPKQLIPGQSYEYRIELMAISHVFLPGHRIRVAVASASWPGYDRNPNTGAPAGDDAVTQPAHQRVFHDALRPSHLLAPVVKRA